MKRITLTIIAFLLLWSINPSWAATTQVDSLIEKLVEKGILTRQEAIKLKGEIAEDEKVVREEGLKESLPGWVRDMKLKGDLRLRYQNEEQERGAGGSRQKTRDRARIRYRLGTEIKANEQAKVCAGLASGGTDPRSTNQTLENTFELKDIRLDYAYGEYASANEMAKLFFDSLIFRGGRMKNPIWEPGDMLWDTDIHPEGVALLVEKNISPEVGIFANTAVFWLDEVSAGSDPRMWVFQPGIKWKLVNNIDLKGAVTFYENNVKAVTLDNSSGSNTLYRTALKYDYDCISPALQLNIKEPFKGVEILDIPYLSLFGEYVDNPDSATDSSGYLLGVKFGDEKVSAIGKWQARYMYVDLKKDAWLDTFPDSDRYSGKTGIIGHEMLFTYGLGKNVNLEFDYYHTNLRDQHDKTEEIIQGDINFKF